MLKLYRIRGGISWQVLFNGKRITAYDTKREAQKFIDEMQSKYGAML